MVEGVSRFQLSVDSGSREEPPTRYFKSAEAAWESFDELPDQWKPYAEVRIEIESRWLKVDRKGGLVNA